MKNFDRDTKIALHSLNQFLSADTFDALWQSLVDFAGSMDMDLLSYHHQLPSSAPGHNNVTARLHGYPDGWYETYLKKRQHVTDPITQVFAGRMRPMLWSEVDNLVTLTPGQMAYLEDLRSWLKGDGLGLPLFGPCGRLGYVGIGRSDTKLDDWGPFRVNGIHWVAQSFHIRWCEIEILQMPKNFTLDARELQILKSLASGTSDEVICGVVGAQLDSVRQSIRNIMKKMEVSDRPSAILRGIGAGLLNPNKVILR